MFLCTVVWSRPGARGSSLLEEKTPRRSGPWIDWVTHCLAILSWVEETGLKRQWLSQELGAVDKGWRPGERFSCPGPLQRRW